MGYTTSICTMSPPPSTDTPELRQHYSVRNAGVVLCAYVSMGIQDEEVY